MTEIILSKGELEMMPLIMQGMSEKDMAIKINKSKSCVRWRKNLIFKKFEVHTMSQLILKYNKVLVKNKQIEENKNKLSGGISANTL